MDAVHVQVGSCEPVVAMQQMKTLVNFITTSETILDRVLIISPSSVSFATPKDTGIRVCKQMKKMIGDGIELYLGISSLPGHAIVAQVMGMKNSTKKSSVFQIGEENIFVKHQVTDLVAKTVLKKLKVRLSKSESSVSQITEILKNEQRDRVPIPKIEMMTPSMRGSFLSPTTLTTSLELHEALTNLAMSLSLKLLVLKSFTSKIAFKARTSRGESSTLNSDIPETNDHKMILQKLESLYGGFVYPPQDITSMGVISISTPLVPVVREKDTQSLNSLQVLLSSKNNPPLSSELLVDWITEKLESANMKDAYSLMRTLKRVSPDTFSEVESGVRKMPKFMYS